MFLDFAEDRARRRQSITMTDWVTRTDSFLVFNERDVLSGPGSVSAAAMKEIATERYAEFDQRRREEEAERAAVEEWDDLRELTAIERTRTNPTSDRRAATSRDASWAGATGSTHCSAGAG